MDTVQTKEVKFISLDKYNLVGHSITSNNNEYSLCWDLGSRTVIFFKNNNIVYDLRNLFFVRTSDVANNGTSIIVGGYNRDDKEDGMLICNEKGEKLFSKYIKAKIFNVAISDDGKTAAFQTYNSMISEDDSGKIFIVDIFEKKITSIFHCPLGWPSQYQFFNAKRTIRLYFESQFIEYTYDGECLEKDKLPIVKKSPFDIYYDLEEKYSEISNDSDKVIIQSFYDNYLSISSEKLTPHVYGVVFRRLGELSLILENKKNALFYFEKANEVYPGIGVKKKIVELKKSI